MSGVDLFFLCSCGGRGRCIASLCLLCLFCVSVRVKIDVSIHCNRLCLCRGMLSVFLPISIVFSCCGACGLLELLGVGSDSTSVLETILESGNAESLQRWLKVQDTHPHPQPRTHTIINRCGQCTTLRTLCVYACVYVAVTYTIMDRTTCHVFLCVCMLHCTTRRGWFMYALPVECCIAHLCVRPCVYDPVCFTLITAPAYTLSNVPNSGVRVCVSRPLRRRICLCRWRRQCEASTVSDSTQCDKSGCQCCI